MLTNLLPGLRDLRAPLAAGYLWLAAGWLCFAPLLPTSEGQADGVLKDIYRVIAASEPIAVGVGLTFAAYLVGILSSGVVSPILRITLIALARRLSLMIVIPILLTVERVEERGRDFYADDVADSFEKRFGALLNPAYLRAKNLVVLRLVKMAMEDQTFRDLLLDKLESLKKNTDLLVHRFFKSNWLYDDELPPWVYNSSIDRSERLAHVREAVSSHLDKRGQFMDETAEFLVKSVVDVNRHASDIVDQLKFVPERIVGSHAAIYERWDRLKAEAEFRQAIVPPLLAIIAALMVRGVLNWPYASILAVVPLILFLQGVGKENEA